MYSLRECEIKCEAERDRERQRKRETEKEIVSGGKSETWTQNSKQNSFVEDNNHLAMHVIGMSKENM